MKHLFNLSECRRLAGVVLALAFCLAVFSTEAAQENSSNGNFVGRWDLTIKESNGKLLPSWLELARSDPRSREGAELVQGPRPVPGNRTGPTARRSGLAPATLRPAIHPILP